MMFSKKYKKKSGFTRLQKILKHGGHGTRLGAISHEHGPSKLAHFTHQNASTYINKKVLPNPERALSYSHFGAFSKTRK